MSELYLVYSLDPRGWIDVYPKWVCELFTKEYNTFCQTGTPQKLELGKSFFFFFLHFKLMETETDTETEAETINHNKNTENMIKYHYQTTTNGGYRSVNSIAYSGQQNINELMYHTSLPQNRGGGWRFKTRESNADFSEVSVEVPPEFCSTDTNIIKVPIWQWAKVTDSGLRKKIMSGEYDRTINLKRLPDKDWVTYQMELSDKIEEAWKSEENSFTVEIGLRKYEIVFEYDRVFAKQIDTLDRTRVRMVRRNPNLTKLEVENLITEWQSLEGKVTEGEICSLCYEPFAQHIPMVTLACKHQFHCSCLQPMLIKNARESFTNVDDVVHHCPLCRDRFTSKEYTDLTGDVISITNSYSGGAGGRMMFNFV